MSTDKEWERWGHQDPYFSVITDPRFRRDRLTPEDLEHFFATGSVHADYTFDMVRRHLDPAFAPSKILDFGCGVGRLLLPFARLASEVTGIDVSGAMLAEAQRNIDLAMLSNIELRQQGDATGLAPSSFDLVHSAIVLQHIEVDRGLKIFAQLLTLVAPRGVGAIQVTYAKSVHADNLGMPPAPPTATPPRRTLILRRRAVVPPPAVVSSGDPVMLMNSYPLTPLLFLLQREQVRSLYIDFTDHGGELGVFVFFQKP